MVTGLRRGAMTSRRVPARRQLLNGRHINHTVVKVRHDLGHVALQETLIHTHRVAAQLRLARHRNILLDVTKHLLLRVIHRHTVLNIGQQTRRLMHRTHKVIHVLQRTGRRLITGLDDELNARTQNVQIGIRDQNAHLDESVILHVQAGHLAVNPYNTFTRNTHSPTLPPNAAGPAGSTSQRGTRWCKTAQADAQTAAMGENCTPLRALEERPQVPSQQ